MSFLFFNFVLIINEDYEKNPQFSYFHTLLKKPGIHIYQKWIITRILKSIPAFTNYLALVIEKYTYWLKKHCFEKLLGYPENKWK